MSLLFDQNLSRKLPANLAKEFPGSTHVALRGLDTASDADVWTFAAAHGLTLVTKDTDFLGMVNLKGFPPKVIWLQLGNCPTSKVESLLRAHQPAIHAFLAHPAEGLLILR